MQTSRSLCILGLVAASAAGTLAAHAAQPASRLRAGADLSARAALPQGVSRRLSVAKSLGGVSSDTQLGLMSLALAPSAAQETALEQLLVAQRTPGSASYHQWLTPQQFGERFGASDADIAILENWLASQGFNVTGVSPSRNGIQFTGSVADAAAAFGTSFGRFQHGTQTWISDTVAPTVPAAYQGIIAGVRGLSTYRPQPHLAKRVLSAAEQQTLRPEYTGTTLSGTVFHGLYPYDVRQIYSANTLVNSGFTGTGVTIAVIGQTAVDTTQLGYFQQLTGQAVKAPNLVLVPNSGVSTTYPGDEGEAESDLEFASGVAPGATVNYVYTGNGTGSIQNPDVFTSLVYAITNDLGQIVTLSYGGCEEYDSTAVPSMEPYLRQASAQGQTVLNSSGDTGPASCDSDSYPTSYDGLAAGYPASSPNVTGVGGTTFVEGNGTYWSTTNNTQRGSALGYIPETAWNDSDSTSISATGGASSILFSKPAWQAGTGVPADGARDVPDIAFSASPNHDPYLLCTSDSTFTATQGGTTYTGQCTATTNGAFVVGGTSLSTPSFGGMLALAEQANGSTGLGNINPILYALAATTPTVFNDVTTGNNQVPCINGTVGCNNGVLGYTAGTGYDLTTGLGSVNIANFSSALTASATAVSKTPTLTVALQALNSNIYTVSVTAPDGATPTGTVSLVFNGGTAQTVTLSGGTAVFTLSTGSLAAGTYTLTATYSGDSTYTSTTTSLSVTVGANTGSFAITNTPSALTLSTGASTTATVALTSTGYTGYVAYTVTSNGTAFPGCFIGGNGDITYSGNTEFLDTSIAAGKTVSVTYTYNSSSTACAALTKGVVPSVDQFLKPVGQQQSSLPLAAFAFGGLALGGLALRKRRVLAAGLLTAAFFVASSTLAGCGSGTVPLSSSTTGGSGTGTGTGGGGSTNTTTTYNVTITATSYPSGTVTASVPLTITLQ